MSLSKKTVEYGKWKKISNAGEDGIIWLWKYSGNLKSNILISHTATTQTHGSPVGDNIPWDDALDLDRNITYILPDNKVSDKLFADDGNDIYYATIIETNQSADIIADFG